jgi:hypothetical protein
MNIMICTPGSKREMKILQRNYRLIILNIEVQVTEINGGKMLKGLKQVTY